MSDGADDHGPAFNLRVHAKPTLSVSSRRRDGRGSVLDTRNEAQETADRRRGELSTSPERHTSETSEATATVLRAAPAERNIIMCYLFIDLIEDAQHYYTKRLSCLWDVSYS